MNGQLNTQRHPEVGKAIWALPRDLIDSFEVFEQQVKRNGDLSAFINTQPFSAVDAVGNRTRIEHYHLRPCRPVCYLVWLVRTVDTVYILDVFQHPPQGAFISSEIEERLYSRLSEVCSELAEYELPGTYRSGLPVHKRDMLRPRIVRGIPAVVPVRAPNSAYLPLGQLTNLSDGRTRVGIIAGAFDIPREEIPAEAIDCIDREEPQDWESLTLYIGGWSCHSGIYRKETEQAMLFFCPKHCVIIRASNRKKPVVVALREQDYRRFMDVLRANFPSCVGKEQELGEIVDLLVRNYPLYRA